MGVAEAAEIAVEQVRMGIEMDHAKRRFTRNAAKYRQRDEMVATSRHGGDTAFCQQVIKILDPVHTVLEVDRVRPDIA